MINAAAFVHVQAAPNPRLAQSPAPSCLPGCAPLPLHAHPFGNLIYFFFLFSSVAKERRRNAAKKQPKIYEKNDISAARALLKNDNF